MPRGTEADAEAAERAKSMPVPVRGITREPSTTSLAMVSVPLIEPPRVGLKSTETEQFAPAERALAGHMGHVFAVTENSAVVLTETMLNGFACTLLKVKTFAELDVPDNCGVLKLKEVGVPNVAKSTTLASIEVPVSSTL